MQSAKASVRYEYDNNINSKMINGYQVNISYSEGKTFYKCVESLIKTVQERLKNKDIYDIID